MTMPRKSTVFGVLLVIQSLSLCHATTVFEIQGTPSCSGAFSLSEFSTSCDSGGCGFGKDVDISGVVTAGSDMSTDDVRITVKACLMSVVCKTILKKDEDLCSMGFEPADGQDCGAAGDYTIDTGFKLPGDDGQDWFSGYWIDVTAKFSGDSFTTTTCKTSLKAKKAYSMAYTTTAAFLGVALIASCAIYGLKNRRRNVVEDQEKEPSAMSFEMMKDPIQTGTVV